MTSYYTDLPFMAHSSCSYCTDLPFIAHSSYSYYTDLPFMAHSNCSYRIFVCILWWIRLICQRFVVFFSSPGRCGSADLLAAMLHIRDSLNFNENVSIHTLIKTVSKFLLPSLLELFCLRFQASLTFGIFSRSESFGAC